MKPHALLIFPPVYDFALFDLFLKPYSLLRIGKWLSSSGYRVKLVNALDYRDPDSIESLGKPRRKACGTGKFFRQIVKKPAVLHGINRNFARYGILKQSFESKVSGQIPDVIFIASGMTYWYPGVVEAVQTVKQFFPGVPVIVGGIYATLCPDHARRVTEADFIVQGEAFPEIKEILESLSLPASDCPIEEELLYSPEVSWESGVIRINRGCPFHCRYCASPLLHGGFKSGDPETAFNTMFEIHEKFGTASFAFYDDALLVEKEKGIIPFLEQVISSGLDLSFYLPNAVHLSLLDQRTARLMYRSGFREVRFGFESASSDFHDSMDQKLNPNRLIKGVGLLRDAGFLQEQISVYVLAGLPGQYAEEVEESVRFAASFGIKVFLAEYSPIPLSPLWQESVQSSSFPLSEEPLTHNNTLLPLRWKGFTLEDMDSLKRLAGSLSAGV